MATPSKKSPKIENLIKEVFGLDRQDFIISNKCTACGRPAIKFKNKISQKEYTISGFCQVCQDEIFG